MLNELNPRLAAHAGSLVEYNSSTRRGSSYPTRSE